MYPVEPLCTVTVKRITDGLCGRFRPGHFDGVATVVAKLFEIVQPEVAYFGEKDAQQLAVIRRMVIDVNLPVEIVGVATVREADGLALSSRNVRLSPEERSKATALYQALREAERAIAEGERDARAVERRAAAVIPSDASLRLEYLDVVDPVELQRVDTIAGTVLVAGALWVGNTRLIDNSLSHMKLRAILKSKIHRAVVTGADIDYVGSVGVDQDLLERTDIIPGERVAIWNINNGIRIDTYAISLPRGSGQIVINGAAARHFHPGDKVIIVAFCLTDEPVEPKMIAVDEQNRFVQDSCRMDRLRTSRQTFPRRGRPSGRLESVNR